MFIVNLKGAVHSVDDKFKLPEGYRKATKPEIAEWCAMQGLTDPETTLEVKPTPKPDEKPAKGRAKK